MKNQKVLSLIAAAFLMSSLSVHAQETTTESSESSLKIEDVTGQKNKVEGDLDEEITNARMRAESGSKSKLSMSASAAYTGSTIEKPLDKLRPPLSADPNTQTNTSMDFGIDARYRISKNESFTLGTSFGITTPFHGDQNPNGSQLNVYNPGVGYSRSGKIGILQTQISLSGDVGTSDESRAVDYVGGLGVSVNGLYGFENGLTIGTSVSTGYNFYSNSPGAVTDGETALPGYYGGDRRTAWSLGIYPYAEFAFNDTFSARTVFGYFNWRHLYGDSNDARLLQTYVYQSVGVGISVTRDVYLYPNIQFVPDNIRSDFTNVAMSATINMF